MSGRRRLLGLTFALGVMVSAAFVPGTAQAGKLMRMDPVVSAKSDSISLQEATRIVRQAYGGRVLSATPATQNGQKGYKVRVLLEGGRVKTVFVDSNGSVR